MHKNLTLKEAFELCSAKGNLTNLDEIDLIKIRSTLNVAESDLNAAKIIKKNIKKICRRCPNKPHPFRVGLGHLLLTRGFLGAKNVAISGVLNP